MLSPSPMPTAIPTASAITFLTAPPSSQPITSGLVYGPEVRRSWQACCSCSARRLVGAGDHGGGVLALRRSPGPGSGPEITAIRSGPAPVTSAITSLIRMWVPSSMPFIRLTSTRVRRQQRGPAAQVLAQRLGGDGQHDQVGAVQRRRRVAGRAQLGRAA